MKIDPKKAAVIGLAATTLFTLTACEMNCGGDLYGPAPDFGVEKDVYAAVTGAGAIADAVAVSGGGATESEVPVKKPEINLSMLIGADYETPLYCDKERLIFAINGGLYVYDLSAQQMYREVDLLPIDCIHTQGDPHTEMHVDEAGKYVYMHTNDCDDQYIYDIEKDTLTKTSYEEFKNNEPKYYDKIDENGRCTIKDDEKKYTVEFCYADSTLGGLLYFIYSDDSKDEYMLEDKHAVFLEDRYRKATLLRQKDIKDIVKAEMFIEGEMREVTDEKVLGKVEAEIRKGRKLKGRSACPFDSPMYITMKDGTYGMIYPAMDSCDAFITADGEYEFKKHENYGLCAILGWTNEVYPSLHVTPME